METVDLRLMSAIRGPDLDELDNAKLIITGAIRAYVQDTYNVPIAR